MCGIAGIFAYHDDQPPVDCGELLRIRDAMVTRGPDSAGLWIHPDARVGLAHRRLAIIDLTAAGEQPMATADGRLRVTFNGEIYNYRALRGQLAAKGYRFRSSSDTEVLLHLYADRGADMVHALRGMYAFAIWDEREQALLLARDPFGIKPLYYEDTGRTLRFASQVKALVKGGAVDTTAEPAGAVGFLLWGSVPEPWTLYRGIRSLPAGSHLFVRQGGRVSITRFFDVGAELRRAEQAAAGMVLTRDRLAEALADTVQAHLASDVPIGLFLSAGLDSTTLAGLAAKAGQARLKAVTLGFREFQGTAQDEVPLAAAVARQFAITHESHWITHEHFDAELESLFEAMDQPSIDGVNAYFVSQAAAAAGLKVAWSGVGGDELFGGYPSFRQVPAAVRRIGMMRPFPFVGRLVRHVLNPFLGGVTSPKYAGGLEYGTTYEGAYLLRRALMMPWELDTVLDRATVTAGLESLDVMGRLRADMRDLQQPRSRVATLEFSWYMRNQLLRDADWAGMAHSVEVRVPLVDVPLFSALAPFLVSDHYPSKQHLAGVLGDRLPAPVAAHPKTGFVTPLASWTSSNAGGVSQERGLRTWAKRVLARQLQPC